ISVDITLPKDGYIKPFKRLNLTINKGGFSAPERLGEFNAVKLKTVIIGVDGLHHSFLKATIANGATPTFRRLFKGAINEASPALSALPTVTWCNWPGIFSGMPPKDHGCIGNAFFERERTPTARPFASACDAVNPSAAGTFYWDRADGIGVVRQGQQVGPGTGYVPSLAERAKANAGSLYDSLAAAVDLPPGGKLICDSICHFYTQHGANVLMDRTYYGLLDTELAHHNPTIARKLDVRTGSEGLGRWNAYHDVNDVMSLYFPGPDNVAHAVGQAGVFPPYTAGPALPDVTNPLVSIREHMVSTTDPQLRTIVDKIHKDGYLYATLFAVTADHSLRAFSNTDSFNIQAEDTGTVPPPVPPAAAAPGNEIQTLFNALGLTLWRGTRNLQTMVGQFGGNDINFCDVIYSPTGGMAQIYIRNKPATGPATSAWSMPASKANIDSMARLLFIESVGYVP
ncbi:MAG: alkaline phosphatase family protein, partial [Patescibacteria group bacterium]